MELTQFLEKFKDYNNYSFGKALSLVENRPKAPYKRFNPVKIFSARPGVITQSLWLDGFEVSFLRSHKDQVTTAEIATYVNIPRFDDSDEYLSNQSSFIGGYFARLGDTIASKAGISFSYLNYEEINKSKYKDHGQATHKFERFLAEYTTKHIDDVVRRVTESKKELDQVINEELKIMEKENSERIARVREYQERLVQPTPING